MQRSLRPALALFSLVVAAHTATAQLDDPRSRVGPDPTRTLQQARKDLAKAPEPSANLAASAQPVAQLLQAAAAVGDFAAADSLASRIDGWIGDWQRGGPRSGDLATAATLRTAQFYYLLERGHALAAEGVLLDLLQRYQIAGTDTLGRAQAELLRAYLYLETGRYADGSTALSSATRLLEQLEPGFSPVGKRLDRLTTDRYTALAKAEVVRGGLLARRGQHDEARSALASFATGDWGKLLGGNHPLVVAAWALLAENDDLAEAPAAAKSYKAALKALRGYYGPKDPTYYLHQVRYVAWQARHDLTRQFQTPAYQADLLRLETYTDRLHKQARKAKAEAAPYSTAPFFAAQARLYHTIGNPDMAARRNQELLAVLQASATPHDHRAWAALRANYATIDLANRRFTNARLYADAFLAWVTAHQGPRSNEYAYAKILQARLELADFKLDSAVAHAQAAVAVDSASANLEPTHVYYLNDLATFGEVLLGASRFERAGQVFGHVAAGQATRFGEASYPWVTTRTQQARVALRMGQFAHADTTLTRTLNYARALPGTNAPLTATVLELLAQANQGLGRFDQAQQYYLEAMRLRRRRVGDDPSTQATSIVGLATLYRDQGRYSDAIRILTEAVTLLELSGRVDKTYLEALATLASIQAETGDLASAEQTARKNRDLVLKTGGKTVLEYGQSLLLLADIVSGLGRYAEAKTYLDEALQSYTQYYGATNLSTAKVYAALSLNQFYLGNPDQALQLITRALGITEAALGTSHLEYAQLQAQLAQLYISLRDYPNAEATLAQVKATQATALGTKHPDYWRTEGQFAALYKLTGRYKESQKAYTGLLAAWERLLGKNHPEYAFYLSDYADLLFVRGDNRGARTVYFEANALLLDQVARYFPALSDQEKAEFWNRISGKLERYYTFVLENGFADPRITAEAYNLRLRTKALLLTASTAIRNEILRSSDPELKELFGQWQARREYLAKLYTLSKEELKTTGASVEDLEAEVNELEKQLSLRSNVFARGLEATPPTWEAVRGRLKSDEAALELIRVRAGAQNPNDSIVYCALIVSPQSPKGPVIVTLPEGNLLERRYLLNYSRAIWNRQDESTSYAKFWEPLEQPLAGKRTVYFSADGVYNKLSLAALKTPGGGFLADRTSIRFVSNTKDLLQERKRSYLDGRTALLVGNPTFNQTTQPGDFVIPPLDGTAREIAQISGLLSADGWNTTVLTQAQANETLVKEATSPKLLHIATHGFFYPVTEGESSASILGIEASQAAQNPLLRSGLFLAQAGDILSREGQAPSPADTTTGPPAPTENGIVTAFEVMNLNLSETELVVLSACETGLGEIRNGEGVYGLQRAFAVAGAKAVIMSLWRVNDQVTERMISRFYQYWIRNKDDIQGAFQQAQQDVRKDFPEAYYWGAFVLVGV
ncbi:MAG: CHAT domain-containing protein [Bacteroidia bacterium]|nr:CHAT domain-containing protein [Bacteroidia bacterium]